MQIPEEILVVCASLVVHCCAVGCIRSHRLFSNSFYPVLKCCILVKNEASKIFLQLVDV